MVHQGVNNMPRTRTTGGRMGGREEEGAPFPVEAVQISPSRCPPAHYNQAELGFRCAERLTGGSPEGLREGWTSVYPLDPQVQHQDSRSQQQTGGKNFWETCVQLGTPYRFVLTACHFFAT